MFMLPYHTTNTTICLDNDFINIDYNRITKAFWAINYLNERVTFCCWEWFLPRGVVNWRTIKHKSHAGGVVPNRPQLA